MGITLDLVSEVKEANFHTLEKRQYLRVDCTYFPCSSLLLCFHSSLAIDSPAFFCFFCWVCFFLFCFSSVFFLLLPLLLPRIFIPLPPSSSVLRPPSFTLSGCAGQGLRVFNLLISRFFFLLLGERKTDLTSSRSPPSAQVDVRCEGSLSGDG